MIRHISIFYSRQFAKEFKKLPQQIQQLANKADGLFRENQHHPSLRLHQLHGALSNYWSISLSSGYRMIFRYLETEEILFTAIGKHNIYKNL